MLKWSLKLTLLAVVSASSASQDVLWKHESANETKAVDADSAISDQMLGGTTQPGREHVFSKAPGNLLEAPETHISQPGKRGRYKPIQEESDSLRAKRCNDRERNLEANNSALARVSKRKVFAEKRLQKAAKRLNSLEDEARRSTKERLMDSLIKNEIDDDYDRDEEVSSKYEYNLLKSEERQEKRSAEEPEERGKVRLTRSTIPPGETTAQRSNWYSPNRRFDTLKEYLAFVHDQHKKTQDSIQSKFESPPRNDLNLRYNWKSQPRQPLQFDAYSSIRDYNRAGQSQLYQEGQDNGENTVEQQQVFYGNNPKWHYSYGSKEPFKLPQKSSPVNWEKAGPGSQIIMPSYGSTAHDYERQIQHGTVQDLPVNSRESGTYSGHSQQAYPGYNDNHNTDNQNLSSDIQLPPFEPTAEGIGLVPTEQAPNYEQQSKLTPQSAINTLKIHEDAKFQPNSLEGNTVHLENPSVSHPISDGNSIQQLGGVNGVISTGHELSSPELSQQHPYHSQVTNLSPNQGQLTGQEHRLVYPEFEGYNQNNLHPNPQPASSQNHSIFGSHSKQTFQQGENSQYATLNQSQLHENTAIPVIDTDRQQKRQPDRNPIPVSNEREGIIMNQSRETTRHEAPLSYPFSHLSSANNNHEVSSNRNLGTMLSSAPEITHQEALPLQPQGQVAMAQNQNQGYTGSHETTRQQARQSDNSNAASNPNYSSYPTETHQNVQLFAHSPKINHQGSLNQIKSNNANSAMETNHKQATEKNQQETLPLQNYLQFNSDNGDISISNQDYGHLITHATRQPQMPDTHLTQQQTPQFFQAFDQHKSAISAPSDLKQQYGSIISHGQSHDTEMGGQQFTQIQGYSQLNSENLNHDSAQNANSKEVRSHSTGPNHQQLFSFLQGHTTAAVNSNQHRENLERTQGQLHAKFLSNQVSASDQINATEMHPNRDINQNKGILTRESFSHSEPKQANESTSRFGVSQPANENLHHQTTYKLDQTDGDVDKLENAYQTLSHQNSPSYKASLEFKGASTSAKHHYHQYNKNDDELSHRSSEHEITLDDILPHLRISTINIPEKNVDSKEIPQFSSTHHEQNPQPNPTTQGQNVVQSTHDITPSFLALPEPNPYDDSFLPVMPGTLRMGSQVATEPERTGLPLILNQHEALDNTNENNAQKTVHVNINSDIQPKQLGQVTSKYSSQQQLQPNQINQTHEISSAITNNKNDNPRSNMNFARTEDYPEEYNLHPIEHQQSHQINAMDKINKMNHQETMAKYRNYGYGKDVRTQEELSKNYDQVGRNPVNAQQRDSGEKRHFTGVESQELDDRNLGSQYRIIYDEKKEATSPVDSKFSLPSPSQKGVYTHSDQNKGSIALGQLKQTSELHNQMAIHPPIHQLYPKNTETGYLSGILNNEKADVGKKVEETQRATFRPTNRLMQRNLTNSHPSKSDMQAQDHQDDSHQVSAHAIVKATSTTDRKLNHEHEQTSESHKTEEINDKTKSPKTFRNSQIVRGEIFSAANNRQHSNPNLIGIEEDELALDRATQHSLNEYVKSLSQGESSDLPVHSHQNLNQHIKAGLLINVNDEEPFKASLYKNDPNLESGMNWKHQAHDHWDKTQRNKAHAIVMATGTSDRKMNHEHEETSLSHTKELDEKTTRHKIFDYQLKDNRQGSNHTLAEIEQDAVVSDRFKQHNLNDDIKYLSQKDSADLFLHTHQNLNQHIKAGLLKNENDGGPSKASFNGDDTYLQSMVNPNHQSHDQWNDKQRGKVMATGTPDRMINHEHGKASHSHMKEELNEKTTSDQTFDDLQKDNRQGSDHTFTGIEDEIASDMAKQHNSSEDIKLLHQKDSSNLFVHAHQNLNQHINGGQLKNEYDGSSKASLFRDDANLQSRVNSNYQAHDQWHNAHQGNWTATVMVTGIQDSHEHQETSQSDTKEELDDKTTRYKSFANSQNVLSEGKGSDRNILGHKFDYDPLRYQQGDTPDHNGREGGEHTSDTTLKNYLNNKDIKPLSQKFSSDLSEESLQKSNEQIKGGLALKKEHSWPSATGDDTNLQSRMSAKKIQTSKSIESEQQMNGSENLKQIGSSDSAQNFGENYGTGGYNSVDLPRAPIQNSGSGPLPESEILNKQPDYPANAIENQREQILPYLATTKQLQSLVQESVHNSHSGHYSREDALKIDMDHSPYEQQLKVGGSRTELPHSASSNEQYLHYGATTIGNNKPLDSGNENGTIKHSERIYNPLPSFKNVHEEVEDGNAAEETTSARKKSRKSSPLANLEKLIVGEKQVVVPSLYRIVVEQVTEPNDRENQKITKTTTVPPELMVLRDLEKSSETHLNHLKENVRAINIIINQTKLGGKANTDKYLPDKIVAPKWLFRNKWAQKKGGATTEEKEQVDKPKWEPFKGIKTKNTRNGEEDASNGEDFKAEKIVNPKYSLKNKTKRIQGEDYKDINRPMFAIRNPLEALKRKINKTTGEISLLQSYDLSNRNNLENYYNDELAKSAADASTYDNEDGDDDDDEDEGNEESSNEFSIQNSDQVVNPLNKWKAYFPLLNKNSPLKKMNTTRRLLGNIFLPKAATENNTTMITRDIPSSSLSALKYTRTVPQRPVDSDLSVSSNLKSAKNALKFSYKTPDMKEADVAQETELPNVNDAVSSSLAQILPSKMLPHHTSKFENMNNDSGANDFDRDLLSVAKHPEPQTSFAQKRVHPMGFDMEAHDFKTVAAANTQPAINEQQEDLAETVGATRSQGTPTAHTDIKRSCSCSHKSNSLDDSGDSIKFGSFVNPNSDHLGLNKNHNNALQEEPTPIASLDDLKSRIDAARRVRLHQRPVGPAVDPFSNVEPPIALSQVEGEQEGESAVHGCGCGDSRGTSPEQVASRRSSQQKSSCACNRENLSYCDQENLRSTAPKPDVNKYDIMHNMILWLKRYAPKEPIVG